MLLANLAMLSVHTSPLARLGGEKTGGMNVYIKELAQEIGSRGIQVDIFTRRSSPELPDIDRSLGSNVNVIHVPAGPQRVIGPDAVYPHLNEFTAGVKAMSPRRYNLIYSHYWLSGLVAEELRDVWHIPYIQMFHTLGHMKNRIIPDYAPTSEPDLRIMSESQVIKSSDRIIAATPAEHSQLLWLYRADRRKITIIPPGVNAARFYPIPMDVAKESLGMPLNMNLLLFVGRIEPLKAVDSILHALKLVQQTTPHLLEQTVFTIIGGDPANSADTELQRLRALTDQLGLTNVVHFIGAKDQEHLHLYYAAALAVIMPSDYESFGMVALEAMASGAPVIASQVGGLAFLVKDGESGFLIPVREPELLAQRLCHLLSAPAAFTHMRLAAVERAKQYTWSAIADRLISVFDGMISTKTGVL
jgi:D-inositol-3-phosphate glycosyltransferase